jgi:hypothetical protein
MARITEDTYRGRTRAPSAVHRLAARLQVEPRTVRQLARNLDVSLYWLDVASGPDVVHGNPASWDSCIAYGIDPVTGEGLRRLP